MNAWAPDSLTHCIRLGSVFVNYETDFEEWKTSLLHIWNSYEDAVTRPIEHDIALENLLGV